VNPPKGNISPITPEEKLFREEISAKIERGYQQSLRGECVDGEEFMAQLLAEIEAFEKAGGDVRRPGESRKPTPAVRR
jgi:hypothetical protein